MAADGSFDNSKESRLAKTVNGNTVATLISPTQSAGVLFPSALGKISVSNPQVLPIMRPGIDTMYTTITW